MHTTLSDFSRPEWARPSGTPSWTARLQLGVLALLVLSLPARAVEPAPTEGVWRADPSGWAEGVPGPEAADRIDRAWRATVPIETRGVAPGRFAASSDLATGVVVTADRDLALVITSAHGVACAPRCRVSVGFDNGAGGFVRSTARVLWSEAAVDLALLQVAIPRAVDPTVLPLPAAGTEIHTLDQGPVLALGFPSAQLLDQATEGERRRRVVAGRWVETREGFSVGYRGSATGRDRGRLEGTRAHLHTAALVPGASGGPLIDASTGRWLGLNTGSLISTRDGACATREARGPCLSLSVGLAPAIEALERFLDDARRYPER